MLLTLGSSSTAASFFVASRWNSCFVAMALLPVFHRNYPPTLFMFFNLLYLFISELICVLLRTETSS